MITITEEIAIPSPPHRVWSVVSNPSDVVSCIDGAELGAAHDDGTFDGALAVKFGAVRVRFAARVSLDLAEDELSGRISARGKDGQGATRFTSGAQFQVRPDGPDSSRVTVRGEVGITGKLARLVESGANAVVARMTKDFAARLIQRCAELDQPVPAGSGAPTAGTNPVEDAVFAPRRPGPLARFGAWLARLLHRRSTVQKSTEEVRSGQAE